MEILNLKEAAIFLKKSTEGLRKLVLKGKIPASKLGGRWFFIKEDIAESMRNDYAKSAETSWGVVDTKRRTIWHSTKEGISGGLSSVTVEKEYNELLEHRIGKQRSNIMIESKLNCGKTTSYKKNPEKHGKKR